ncbi:unnamed protein product, partial [Mesorhabditis belari]|uniref:Inositol polyphosphate-related phosphatase domain-containing protein n=1 Tax=Mesorhabditis belari TaxID=2138241 RepID=A0AAF3EV79_9BILA
MLVESSCPNKRLMMEIFQLLRLQKETDTHFTQPDDHTWMLLPQQNLNHKVTRVTSFGHFSIPDYGHLGRHLPNHSLSILAITWNLNEKQSSIFDPFTRFLIERRDSKGLEDIIVIGLQEIRPQTRTFHEIVLEKINAILSQTHQIYFSVRYWSQMMLVSIRKQHVPYAIACPDTQFVPSNAVAKPVRTKGSIGVAFKIYQRTLAFVSSHFSHGSITQRWADYNKTLKKLSFQTIAQQNKGNGSLLAADVVVWMGDLNFRIQTGTVMVPNPNRRLCFVIDVRRYLEKDELLNFKQKAIVFAGFEEAEITFPPSYKFQSLRCEYDKKRQPSYTDRVLYFSSNKRLIEAFEYNCLDFLTESDHRPVYCSLRILALNKEYKRGDSEPVQLTGSTPDLTLRQENVLDSCLGATQYSLHLLLNGITTRSDSEAMNNHEDFSNGSVTPKAADVKSTNPSPSPIIVAVNGEKRKSIDSRRHSIPAHTSISGTTKMANENPKN